MEKKQTVLQQIIEKLLADSKYLNGENDCKEDRIVGQYLKTIADDLSENYLKLERQQIIDAFNSGYIESEEDNGIIDIFDMNKVSDASNYYNITFNK